MRETVKYRVYSGGAVDAGFEINNVVSGFATLFKVSEDQAALYVGSKKLIRKDLSEREAVVYRNKIKAIGLLAVVIGEEAVNDQAVPVKTVTKKPALPECQPKPEPNYPSEPVGEQLICPKCSLMQPKSDECTKCGLIFSKYRDPNYRPKYEPEEAGDKTGESKDPVSGTAAFGDIVKRHKRATLFFLVFTIMLVSAALTQRSGIELAGGIGGPVFTQKSQSSAKVNQLMSVADLNSAFDGFDESLQQLFSEQLPPLVKERGGAVESVTFIKDMLPNAYNEKAGRIALSNWLQITLEDSELDELIALYQSVDVQKFTEFAGEKKEGTADHEFFLASYANNPPGQRRRQALEKLVDVTALDQFMMMVWSEGQTSIITLAASTGPGFTSKQGAERTSQSIRDMRDMLPFAQGPIREEAIKTFAWQLESFELMEIQALGRALDTPAARNLFSEIRRGVESYMEDATGWLVTLSAREAGNL